MSHELSNRLLAAANAITVEPAVEADIDPNVKKFAVQMAIKIGKSLVIKAALVIAKKYNLPLKKAMIVAYWAMIDILREAELNPSDLLHYRMANKDKQVWDLAVDDPGKKSTH